MMWCKLVRCPSSDELNSVKDAALTTMGLERRTDAGDKWLRMIAEAEHSPIRRLRFEFSICAPYWLLNELRTHHAGGCEMFMQSSRNDRQDGFDRNSAPQGMERMCRWDCNLQNLIDISRRRLCSNASKEMRMLVGMITGLVVDVLPWTAGLFVPMCDYRGGVCHEMKCCGRRPWVWEEKQ